MAYTTGLVRFNSGEISPLMAGRIDTEEYRGACKLLKNFIPSVQGPVSRRGGTRFVQEAKYHDKKARLFSFNFSANEAYLMEFGHKYVRFFFNRHTIINQDDSVYEIETPYTEDDLEGLYFSQSGDIVFIAHSNYPLKTITRLAQTNWVVKDVELVDGPYLPVHTGDISITPSGVTGDITLTASENLFCEQDVGRLVRLMHPRNPEIQWGVCKITAYTNEKKVSATVYENMPILSATATKHWRLGVFSIKEGYASVCTFFEQRLILAKGNGVYGSKTGQYDNFAPTDAEGLVTLNYGYGYEISSDQINDVCWLSSGRELAIGTVGADFTLITAGGEASIPMTVKVRRHSTYGSQAVAPIKVGDSTLFVQNYGRKLRAFVYDSNSEGYLARDLTTLSAHITNSGIHEMALQKEPCPIVWCVLNNGDLIGLTYEPEESVEAWHRHEIANGKVEALAVLPAENRAREELFLLVKRTINGQVKRYIEVMESGIDEDAVSCEEGFFLDSGLSYHGEEVLRVGGLSHLENETVSVFADGAVQTDKVVENGQIELDTKASVIHVGLGFSSVLQTMPLAGVGQETVTEASVKRISGLYLRVHNTIGFSVGSAQSLERQVFSRFDDILGESPSLFSGDKKVTFNAKWDRNADICVVQNQPLPLTVLGIFPIISTSRI